MVGRSTLGILFAVLLMPRLPDAIPATELRTHADTVWLVGAAAQALPYNSVRSAGANSFPTSTSPADTGYAGDRARLAMVAWALEVPFDSADAKAPPPVCPSDSAAPRLNGYRVEHVRISKSDSAQDKGKKGWFHYIVTFTRVCWTQGKANAMTSDVDFDAVPDSGTGYEWRVGWRRHDPDPVRPAAPYTYQPSFADRYPTFVSFALVLLFFGPLVFPAFGYAVAKDAGQAAFAVPLAVWSIVGLALSIIVFPPAFIPSFFMFVVPAVAYVAAVAPDRGSSRLKFGRATAVCLGVYAVCFVLWFFLVFSGVALR